jgi:hypothetical protein
MAEFREQMPILTGPGAYFISLAFIALLSTSNYTFTWVFDLEKTAVLIAISFPISVFITQLYHAFFTKFGYEKKDWVKRFSKYTKDGYLLDSMVDYLSWEKDLGQKEWFVIQKRYSAFILFNMLKWTTFGFFVLYLLFCLILVILKFCLCPQHYSHVEIRWWGIALTSIVCIVCILTFRVACKKVWNTFMCLDSKLIEGIEKHLIEWLKKESS